MKESIAITGVWLRSYGRGDIQILIERDGRWYKILEEQIGGSISHIVESLGILNAPEECQPAVEYWVEPIPGTGATMGAFQAHSKEKGLQFINDPIRAGQYQLKPYQLKRRVGRAG